MPIYCNYYDINLYQGQSFFLDLFYQNDNGDPIDLNGNTYEARMQVRRSPLVQNKLLSASSNNYPDGLIGGGKTGFFNGSAGRPGTGGIVLNYGGETGALRIEIDYITTSYLPPGRHFYDVDIKNEETNFVDKIVTGTFEVTGEVTRDVIVDEALDEDQGPESPVGTPIRYPNTGTVSTDKPDEESSGEIPLRNNQNRPNNDTSNY